MSWMHTLFLLQVLANNCESVVYTHSTWSSGGYTCHPNARDGAFAEPTYIARNVIFLNDVTRFHNLKLSMLDNIRTFLYYYFLKQDSVSEKVKFHFMGNNRTDLGLEILSNLTSLMKSKEFGESSNMCYILTTFPLKNSSRVIQLAESVKESGMNIAVVGVGIEKSDYIDVATNPEMVFVAEDFVQSIEESNGEEIATAVIEASKEAAYLPQFIYCGRAYVSILVLTDVEIDPQETLRDVRKFGSYFDKKITDLTAIVLNTPYSHEQFIWSFRDEQRELKSKENLLSGITFACQYIIEKLSSSKREHTLLLAVDQIRSDINDLHNASKDCQRQGIHIMALGIGPDMHREQLEMLVSDQKGIEMADKGDNFTLSIAELYKTICKVMCPAGWVFHSGSCFKYESGNLAWFAARDRCSRIGASLVSVSTPSKHYWLYREFFIERNQSVFIGLRKYPMKTAPIGRMFRWLDGKPLVFTKWDNTTSPPEPNGASYEDCVVWDIHGWADIVCSAVLNGGFICEMKSMFAPTEKHQGVIVPPLSMGRSCESENDAFNKLVYGHRCEPISAGFRDSPWKTEGFACESGELVSKFLLCDGLKQCQDGSDELNCDEWCSDEQYRCNNGRCVSIAYVCDFWDDCGDNSDENMCSFSPCNKLEWQCGNGQCIPSRLVCDMNFDCYDRSDEETCSGDACQQDVCDDGSCIPWSWLNDGVVDCPGGGYEDEYRDKNLCYYGGLKDLHFIFEDIKYSGIRPNCTMVMDGLGKRRTNFSLSLTEEDNCDGPIRCPVGFYRCPNSYCIAIVNVCNGYMDCINGEDEIGCESYNCPGYFRCPNSKVCIHPALVCDREMNCPGGRDEVICNFQSICPQNCTCSSGVIRCEHFIPSVSDVFDSRTRKVIVTDSDVSKVFRSEHFTTTVSAVFDYDMRVSVNDRDISKVSRLFTEMPFLLSMTIVKSGLSNIRDMVTNKINLRELNISWNQITEIPDMVFSDLKGLKILDISFNPIHNISNSSFIGLDNLQKLYMKYTSLTELTKDLFKPLSKLQLLDIEGKSIVAVRDGSFEGLKSLESLYFQENPISFFGREIYSGMDLLKQLHTSVFSLCCIQIRPKSLREEQCVSPKSSISSCDDLLNSDILRSSIWVLCISSLIGNVVSTLMRVIWERPSMRIGYGVFVTHLGIADFLMGIYLLIIAIADVNYKGNYIMNDHAWRNSGYCKLAGVLSTFSSEASMMFICLITIDRFMVIKFPFSKIRFRFISATLCSTLAWIIAGLLATIPLLPSLAHWEFYTKTGACLALPYATERKPGWIYSTAIYVGFNFVAFIFMAFGQLSIYREVRAASMIQSKQRSDQEMAIARRLVLIVATDFLCWFPIGVMSILALAGVSIGGEAFVWTAVFILPVNAAINPFCYTILTVKQNIRKRKQRELIGGPVSASDVKVIIGEPGENFVPLPEAIKQMKTLEDKFTLMKNVLQRVTAYMTTTRDNKQYPVFLSMRGKVMRTICLSTGSEHDLDDITKSIYSLSI